MKRFWAIPLVLVVLGCTTPEKVRPPTVDLANLRLGSTGLLSQQFNLDLKIGNPNDFSIPVTGLAFQLEVNGQPFADGLSNTSVTVPRLGYAMMPVEGNTNTMNLIRQIMTLGERDRIDYRLFGTAYIGRLVENDAVPFEKRGSLSLLPAPLGHGSGPGGFRSFAPSPR